MFYPLKVGFIGVSRARLRAGQLTSSPSALTFGIGVIPRAPAAPGLRGIAMLRILPNCSGVSDGVVPGRHMHSVAWRRSRKCVSAPRYASAMARMTCVIGEVVIAYET